MHGFKWLFDPSGRELDDSGLLEVTLDTFANAIRMTALHRLPESATDGADDPEALPIRAPEG